MHLSIGSLNPLTPFFTYESSYILLLLKENTNVFSHVKINFLKLRLLIDWKAFLIILSPYILTKQFSEVDLKMM